MEHLGETIALFLLVLAGFLHLDRKKLRGQITILKNKLAHSELSKMEKDAKQSRNLACFQALLDRASDHVYFKDLASRFILINRSMAKSFHLKHPDEATGKTDFDFFAMEHAQQAYDDEQRIIRTGVDMEAKEERETWPDGRITWVSSQKWAVHDPHNRIVGTFGVSRDVTEKNKLKEELDRYTEDLKRSNEELEQFAYVSSHDLQEPLRMVASYTQLLAQRYSGKLDSDADEFIRYAVDGATRMQRLIEDLLAYSRVGSKPKQFQKVSMEKILQQARSNLEMAIEDAKAEIIAGVLPDVLGDPVQLGQLVQNLLANAIKFRHKDRVPRIEINAREEEDHWLFSVTDNGIGIEPQYAERIFLMFQRLHSRQEYAGTGIGLAICRKIAQKHGGDIRVEQAPGGGSRFCFTIPAKLNQV